MKKMIMALIVLSSFTAQAASIACTVAAGPRNGRPSKEAEITVQDGRYFVFERFGGYVFNGSCSNDGCSISISLPNDESLFTDFNAAFSPKVNNNSVSISIFNSRNGVDDVAQITCQKSK